MIKIKFTNEQFLTMLRLQSEANDVMSTDWRDSTNDQIAYYRAAIQEASEAINWFGFKWWKKTEPNVKQIEMELIDILHFALSDIARAMYECDILNADSEWELNEEIKTVIAIEQDIDYVTPLPVGNFVGGVKEVIMTLKPEIRDEDLNFVEACEQFIYDSLDKGRASFTWLRVLFDKMNMDGNKAFSLYIGKNVLNKFRTHNGQINNQYIKIWNGKEDNEYLYTFLEDCLSSGRVPEEDEIWNYLQAEYSVVV